MAANPSSLENIPYPLTHEGQCQFMADLMEPIRQVSEGRTEWCERVSDEDYRALQ